MVSVILICLVIGCSKNFENITLLYDPDWPLPSAVEWLEDEDKFFITTSSFSRNIGKIYLYNETTREGEILLETFDFDGRVTAVDESLDQTELLFVAEAGNFVFTPGIWRMPLEYPNETIFVVEGNGAKWLSVSEIILYRVEKSNNENFIYVDVFNIQENTSTNLLRIKGVSANGFSLSRDQGLIIFSLTDEKAVGDIYSLDIETGDLHRITHDSLNMLSSVAPSGEMIAYLKLNEYKDTTEFHLHIMNIDGTCDYELGLVNISTGSMDWSPDSKRLAFITTNGVAYLRVQDFMVAGAGEGDCP
jgi:Tol biopolymer transport system component